LRDSCDPDDDNDGVPDELDCGSTNYAVHGIYKYPADGSLINIPAHVEICDTYDNDCNGAVNDSPDLHTKVDMVFTIDISGSMQAYIDGISDAISRFVNGFAGSDHRFGLVVFGQNGPAPFETAGPHGRVVINLTDAATFSTAFSALTANGGGVEPMYDSVYELARSNNLYGINWRNDAHPYIVVATDEPPTCGNPIPGGLCAGPVDPQWKTKEAVSAKVSACEIGGCVGHPGLRVETFVIAPTAHYQAWDSIIYNDQSHRFVGIIPPSGTSCADYYFAKLQTTTFANVCTPAGNPVIPVGNPGIGP
jgi:hypothetical protein